MHQGALSLSFPSVTVWLCGCDLAAPPFNIAAEASCGKHPTCHGGLSPGSRAALSLVCEHSGKSLWSLTLNLQVEEHRHYPVCLIPPTSILLRFNTQQLARARTNNGTVPEIALQNERTHVCVHVRDYLWRALQVCLKSVAIMFPEVWNMQSLFDTPWVVFTDLHKGFSPLGN